MFDKKMKKEKENIILKTRKTWKKQFFYDYALNECKVCMHLMIAKYNVLYC